MYESKWIVMEKWSIVVEWAPGLTTETIIAELHKQH